jgi:hypothetical protein
VATLAQRRHLAALMRYLIAHRGQLDYPPGDQRDWRDSRSWQLSEQQAEHLLGAGGRMQLDCSEMGAWLLKAVGCWHWSSPGYTGTHLELLPVYHDPKLAGVGALAVFGGGTGHHEAIVLTPDAKGGNPLMFSHGRPGVDVIRLRDEAARQASSGHPGVRLLSIAHL